MNNREKTIIFYTFLLSIQTILQHRKILNTVFFTNGVTQSAAAEAMVL